MKKIAMFAVGIFMLMLAFGTTVSASELPKTTWQVYYTGTDILLVHVNDDQNSAICWEGKAHVVDRFGMLVDNYQNQCVSK